MTNHLPATRRDPFGSMFTLHDEVRDLFRDFFRDAGLGGAERPREGGVWAPAVDIEETDRAYLVTADLPGVDQKNVKVSIDNEVLTLRGERRSETTDDRHGRHRMERTWGAFERSFSLPRTVDGEHVRAEYKDGVLTITLPKKAGVGPKAIDVKVG